jgi:uncharacterized membrane-anchored protein YitT (DUF2179 family)
MTRPLREAVNAALIAAGILSAGMGLKGFLLSSRFIDGGVTGISMLRSRTSSICVVTRLEIGKVKTIVREIDGAAFVVYHPLSGAEGGVVTRLGAH